MEKKFQRNLSLVSAKTEELLNSMEKICEGLVYVSEVDSPVVIFAGDGVGSLIRQIDHEPGQSAVEVDLQMFFDRLTMPKDWHGDRERVRAKKFLDLRKLIEENLIEPKVFRLGDTHVRIVVAGLDSDGRAVGVSMTALET